MSSKLFISAAVLVAILAFFGSVLIYTSSSLINSRSSLENMVNQQAVERKLQEQNERHFNDLYERYEESIRKLEDYQTTTTRQMERYRERLERIERYLDKKSNGDIGITINNNPITTNN